MIKNQQDVRKQSCYCELLRLLWFVSFSWVSRTNDIFLKERRHNLRSFFNKTPQAPEGDV